jgi:hypothetical protein
MANVRFLIFQDEEKKTLSKKSRILNMVATIRETSDYGKTAYGCESRHTENVADVPELLDEKRATHNLMGKPATQTFAKLPNSTARAPTSKFSKVNYRSTIHLQNRMTASQDRRAQGWAPSSNRSCVEMNITSNT